jgi:hypothetical protein
MSTNLGCWTIQASLVHVDFLVQANMCVVWFDGLVQVSDFGEGRPSRSHGLSG